MRMKLLRWIALSVLFATMLGVFGCAGVQQASKDSYMADVAPNFIGSKSYPLNTTKTAERPAELLNFGATDAAGAPLFQIVYKLGASEWQIEECNRLSDVIFEVTGVRVPVVHSMEKQKEYEIVIGDVPRSDLLDIKDGVTLGAVDFFVKAVGTRVMIFSRNDMAVVSAIMYFTDTIAYRNAGAKEFGIASDFELLQVGVGDQKIELLSVDEHYVEMKVPYSISISSFVRLSYTGMTGWRIQTKFDESDTYDDFGASQWLARSLGEKEPSALEKITVREVGGVWVAEAADGSCAEIDTDGVKIEFYTPSGMLAATITEIITNRQSVSISGLLNTGEAIYGTGERFNNANQRGKKIDLYSADIWSTDHSCYMEIPLLCFSRGSGVFVNRYEQMKMDLDSAARNIWKVDIIDAPIDVYVFTTDKIADSIQCYSELSGYAGMPEEWTYGMIVCSYGPELSKKWSAQIKPDSDGRNEGVYEMIANMEKYDLPWTGILAEYWPYRSGSSSHKDLKELCDYVHSLGKKFIVYMGVAYASADMGHNPKLATRLVGPFEQSYYLYQSLGDGKKTHLIPQTTVNNTNPDNGGGTRTYLDITNPDAVDWFFNEYWEYIADDIGADGCKIDFCEQVPENQTLLYYDTSTPTVGSHHWFPTAFCAMFWEAISTKPDSGMCFTRGGGIGSQRAPYMWAGDQTRTYPSLYWQLRAVLSSGLSGVPYMSYDIAGYSYDVTKLDLAAESQILIRGLQFSAYTICMQTHGTVRRAYQFAEEDPAYAYVPDIYRAYVKLHEHLTPYITELCEAASATGMPVMRHMVFGWPEDKNVYDLDTQYMFGDAFLVAPILNEGYSRNIYLPEGEWMDLNTGEEYTVGKGGKWLNGYAADLTTLPTFYNKNTASEIAPTLVNGIAELYDYANSLIP